MAQFGKNRFPEGYQKDVGMKANKKLHQNSKELVSILKENFLPVSDFKVFELGGGGAWNLHYIAEEFPGVKLYCSDLFRDASMDQMSSSIKDKITFYEGDSEDVINENIIDNLDLLLVSDHFMHLQYGKADNIIKSVISKWKPKYVMLRELKKEGETPNHPRLFHDYNQFLDSYDMMFESSSKQDTGYFIWLLKRKKGN